MPTKSKQKRLEQGHEARVLLENPIYQAAVSYASQQAEQRLANAESPDEAWNALLALRAVLHQQRIIDAYIRDGEQAAASEIPITDQQRDEQDAAAVEDYMKRAREARAEYARLRREGNISGEAAKS